MSGVLDAQVPADSGAQAVRLSFAARHTQVTAATGLLAGAATISLFDNHLAQETRRFRNWSGPGTQHAFHLTSSVGGYLPLALGGTLALTGWATHHDFTRRLGTDVVSAVVTSGVITVAIKGSVGRARPSRFPEDPDMYYPGQGFFNTGLASFPSGHTSAAFAGATVLVRELSKAHPTQSKWIKFGILGGATAIGLSRMYENAHWASDVFAGAAVGTLSGTWIVRKRNAKP
jgi:membrane-associated phospholipid phosphatase